MVDREYKIHTIEENGKKYYCAQHIAQILGYDCGYNLIRPLRNFKMDDIIKSKQYLNFRLITMTYIGEKSLRLLLTKNSKAEAIDLARWFGLDTIVAGSPERNCIKKISIALPHLELLEQYTVGKYRADGYSKKYNIVVECDEGDHKHYDKEQEEIRTQTVNKLLNNPTWIRFNPKDDIFGVIGKISILMINYEKESHS